MTMRKMPDEEGPMRCPSCNSADSVEVEINLVEDSPFTFRACRRCETRWWQRDGRDVPITEVLDLVDSRVGKKRRS